MTQSARGLLILDPILLPDAADGPNSSMQPLGEHLTARRVPLDGHDPKYRLVFVFVLCITNYVGSGFKALYTNWFV